jgi:DNA helicase-2/ATP-dependent DNA helicase PcrA
MMGFTPTPEQQAVIDHPLQPLRVAAGAGTGKTATIVARLAAAVHGGIRPEAALGITFTNKAAEELADRLRATLKELSAEGREVQVTTYHGFAHQVLEEFGALVGVERGAQIIGAGFQRQLLDESLAAHRYTHLDMTAPAIRVDEAATLARQLGDNLLTPGDLALSAPSGADDVWPKRLELTAVLETYADEKHRLGVVDYADLIRLAHRLVEEYPEIADRVRSRYELAIVDEYQDTDPGQRLLLQAIFGRGFPITAVGDPDQTIYEWRGATTSNFANFPEHFPTASGARSQTLPLTLNRRSDRAILDGANAIRSELHDRFDVLHPLDTAGDGSIVTGWLRTVRDEAAWLADEVRTLHDEEGVAWRQIAVLFRKNRSIAPVREALHQAGVPVDVVSLGGLLSVPEVAEVHAWMKALHDPEDSPAVARILLGGRYRLGLGDLAALSRWARRRERSHRGRSDHPVLPGYPLLEAMDNLDDVVGLSGEARRRIDEFAETYRELLVTAQGVTLSELCRRILDALDAWAEVDALPPNAALSARLNLHRFLDRAESWSPLEGRPSLGAFLGYLDVLEQEAAAEELDVASPSTDDAVSLMTVHRAKGLEWDVVFLPALEAGTFPAVSQGYDNPVDYPRYLPYELRVDAATLPDLADAASAEERRKVLAMQHGRQEWRTAYVAVTRARHRLYATGASWHTGQRSRLPSELWQLLDGLPSSARGPFVADPGPKPAMLPDLGVAAPDPLFPGGWQHALALRVVDPAFVTAAFPDLAADVESISGQLRMALDGLPQPLPPEPDPLVRMSVTGLVTMALCPLRFRWAEVDRLPRRPDRSLRRGVDFHRKAELHNLGVVPLEEGSSDLYDVAADEGGGRGASAFDAFLASRFAAERPRFVEVPIEIRLANARIRGRVDAVYDRDGSWEIVDYKSGRKREEGHSVVQLQAYALAASEGAIVPSPPDSLSVTFAYFGGGTAAESTWRAGREFVDAARDRISGLATMAHDGDFPATPSPACTGCDFLRFCDSGREYVAARP